MCSPLAALVAAFLLPEVTGAELLSALAGSSETENTNSEATGSGPTGAALLGSTGSKSDAAEDLALAQAESRSMGSSNLQLFFFLIVVGVGILLWRKESARIAARHWLEMGLRWLKEGKAVRKRSDATAASAEKELPPHIEMVEKRAPATAQLIGLQQDEVSLLSTADVTKLISHLPSRCVGKDWVSKQGGASGSITRWLLPSSRTLSPLLAFLLRPSSSSSPSLPLPAGAPLLHHSARLQPADPSQQSQAPGPHHAGGHG